MSGRNLGIAVACLLLLGMGMTAKAVTFTSTKTGNWSVGATWDQGVATPGASDDVVIASAHVVTVDVAAAECQSLKLNASATTAAHGVTISGTNSLTVFGAVTMTLPTATVMQTISVGAGTFTAASIVIPGTSTGNKGCAVTVSTGTIDVSGNISFSGTAAQARFTSTGASIVKVGGNFGSGGTLSAGTGTIIFNGSGAQGIGLYSTYYNVTVDKDAGTATLLGAITVGGNLTVSAGTLADGAFQITGNAAGLLVVASDATLQIGTGTSTKPNFPANYVKANISLATSSTVIYNSTGAQVISGVPDYGNLTINGNSTKTAGASLTVNGNLTVNAGTLADGGYQITGNATGTLSVASDATLQIGTGTTVRAFPTNFTAENTDLATTSTVNYNWATTTGGLISATPTYGNLTVTGAITKTAAGPLTVNGKLTMATASGPLADGGYTITAKGDVANTGGHTSTGSGKILLAGGSAAHSLTGTSPSYGNLELDDAQGATISVVFSITGDLTVTAGTFTVANGITVTGATDVTGTLAITSTSGTKTFGDVSINSDGTWNNTAVTEAVEIKGILSTSGEFNAGAGVYTFSGTGKTIDGTLEIPSATVTGTYTNNGILTVGTALAGTGGLTNAADATLNLGGTATTTTLTADANPNTVNYTSTAADRTAKGTTYHHLTIDRSGRKTTLDAATTVNGNLTVSAGTLADGGFQITGNATGTLLVASGATLQIGAGTATVTAFPTNFIAANITLTGSTVTYNWITTTTGLISATPTYGNLTVTGAITKTAAGALTVNGNLSMSTASGRLADNGNVITVKGNVANTGGHTSTGSGKILLTGGSANHALSGTGPYGNLELDDAQGATMGAAFNINGDLTVTAGTFSTSTYALTVDGSVTNNGTITRAGTATFTASGGFTNNGTYTATAAASPLTVGTTAAGGTFTNDENATFSNGGSGNGALTFNGDFTNNQADADFGTGLVTFGGDVSATLNSAVPLIFGTMTVNKGAPATEVLMAVNVTVSAGVPGALTVTQGTLTTNSRDLTVNGGSSASVAGGVNGYLRITGNSTVDICGLEQASAKLRSVVVEGSPTVNIFGTHTLHCGVNRCAISGGTVSYQFDGTQLSLPDPGTDAPDGGWFATGNAEVYFSRDISAVSRAVFAASDDAVVRFVGDIASNVTLHNSTGNYTATWEFNDLRAEKPGGAKVFFKTVGIGQLRTAVCASKLTVSPAAEVALGGVFSAAANGYRIADIINQGSLILPSGSEEYSNNNLSVAGDWSGAGNLTHGNKTVTFDGSGHKTISGSFYDLTVNKPAGSLTLAGNLAVQRNLAVNGGTFAVGERTLALGTGSNPGSVTVNLDGIFSAVGSGRDAKAVVTAASAGYPYGFAVNNGGGIAARFATFERMGADGIVVNSYATVDENDNFSFCTFDHGDFSGQMLRIMNTQNLDMTNVDFSGTAGNNIAKPLPATSGRITVFRGSGTRWGPAYELDPSGLIHWSQARDVGVTAILRPAGTVSENSVVYPKMTVKNYGGGAETFLVRCIITDNTGIEKFNQAEQVTSLGIGQTREFQFTTYSWPATPQGSFHVRCTTELAGDMDNSNDKQERDFTVGRPERWSEVKPMPNTAPSSGKPVKDGGWLAVGPNQGSGVRGVPSGGTLCCRTARSSNSPVGLNQGSGSGPQSPTSNPQSLTSVIYAAKGYKTTDFFKYVPTEGDSGAWHGLEPIPHLEGAKTKPPSKGCVGVSDGENYVYMTKGNNTLGFWRYNVDADTWEGLPGVPEGPNRKKVKGGTDMVYAVYKDTGCIILLKGYKTEFYRFNTEAERWDTLPVAPSGGGKAKYDKGSFLVYDGTGYIYCHQAKYYDKTAGYHYMFRYDLGTSRWDTCKGMPIAGMHGGKPGKNKKSKDGAGGAWLDENMYALKGGNTQQFFKYIPLGDSWYELDTMPAFGSTGKKKYVKYGADLASYGSGALFALKGNKTFELWRYVIPVGYSTQNTGHRERSGVMAGNVEVRTSKFELFPNPIASGFALLRIQGIKDSRNQVANVRVFDASGRCVLARPFVIRHSTLDIPLDLRKLSSGVYLVRLDADSYTATQKLVVQR